MTWHRTWFVDVSIADHALNKLFQSSNVPDCLHFINEFDGNAQKRPRNKQRMHSRMHRKVRSTRTKQRFKDKRKAFRIQSRSWFIIKRLTSNYSTEKIRFFPHFLNETIFLNEIPEDLAFSTGGRPIFKCK